MKDAPELYVMAGPGQGSCLKLSARGGTFSIGERGSDLALPNVEGRLEVKLGANPAKNEVTVETIERMSITINGSPPNLPQALEAGDVITIAGQRSTLVEYRDPLESPGPATDEMVAQIEDRTEKLDDVIARYRKTAAKEKGGKASTPPSPAAAPAPAKEERVLADDEETTLVTPEIVQKALENSPAVEPAAEAPKELSPEDETVVAEGPLAPLAKAPEPTADVPVSPAEDRTVTFDRDAVAPPSTMPTEERPTIMAELIDTAPEPAPVAAEPIRPEPAPEPATPPEERTVLSGSFAPTTDFQAIAPPAIPSPVAPEEATVLTELAPTMEAQAMTESDAEKTVLGEIPRPVLPVAQPRPEPRDEEKTVLGPVKMPEIPKAEPRKDAKKKDAAKDVKPPEKPAPKPPKPATQEKAAKPAPPPKTPPAPVAAPKSGGGGGMKIVLVLGAVLMLVFAVGLVVVVKGMSKHGDGTPSPTAPTPTEPPKTASTPPTSTPTTIASVTPSTPAPSPSPTTVSPVTPAAPAARIVRIDPPAAPAGAEVTIETEGVTGDAQVFFGPTAAAVVSHSGGSFRVKVPELGGIPSAPVTVRQANMTTPEVTFAVATPALPAVAFHPEVKAQSYKNGDTATLYLGPIPLLIVASKAPAPSVAEKAQTLSLNLDTVKTTLQSSPDATLKVGKGPRDWEIQVVTPGSTSRTVVATVGADEVAYVAAASGSSPVQADKLAGYWMSVVHDALAVGFGIGRPDLLPEDAPASMVLRKMSAGGLDKGFATLTPEERQTLENIAVQLPASLGGFEGKFTGTTTLDRKSFPEITWPNAQLQIELQLQPSASLTTSGDMKLIWITALDESGNNKTFHELGRYTVSGAALDPSNLNHLTFTIDHGGSPVAFDLVRKVDQAKVPSLEGRYGGTTNFLLKKL
ncbi:MAG: hypothetical protein U0166_20555 [Acidobacteriota bacterium]